MNTWKIKNSSSINWHFVFRYCRPNYYFKSLMTNIFMRWVFFYHEDIQNFIRLWFLFLRFELKWINVGVFSKIDSGMKIYRSTFVVCSKNFDFLGQFIYYSCIDWIFKKIWASSNIWKKKLSIANDLWQNIFSLISLIQKKYTIFKGLKSVYKYCYIPNPKKKITIIAHLQPKTCYILSYFIST